MLTFWVALAKILCCAFCNAVLHMQAYKAWGSPNIPAYKWGGGGGPPLGGVQWNWSQIGRFGLPGPSPKLPKSSLLGACAQDASQEAPKWIQKGSQGGPRVDFRRIFDRFGSLCSLFLAVKMHSLNQNSRYHMYLLSDAIT